LWYYQVVERFVDMLLSYHLDSAHVTSVTDGQTEYDSISHFVAASSGKNVSASVDLFCVSDVF